MEKGDIQNVYAYNVKDEEIHISEAESGRKGYFCLGCKKEMQAVKAKIKDRASYFRHDHNASPGEKKCTYSDETYRHKLAKAILIRTKRVKVPSLYKYPPKNIEGDPILIEESKFVEAYSVSAELSFYESAFGEVKWGKSIIPEENHHLLMRPDITFFNKDNYPILFIEIVATHKLLEDKQLKLKRIGVDTIQVNIPKDSPENIERTFEKSNRTKWIYNYEQENTEYVRISNSSAEGIPSIDEDQRKFFEESYKCRTAQINNLIRTIARCLGSEQYRRIEQNLKSEISRVEKNTSEHKASLKRLENENVKQLHRLRKGIEDKVSSEFGERRERIDKAKKELGTEEKEFRESCSGEDQKYESEIESHKVRFRTTLFPTFETKRDRIEERYRELEERYNSKRRTLEESTRAALEAIEEIRRRITPGGGESEKEEIVLAGLIEQRKNIEERIREIRDNEESERSFIDREKEIRTRIREKYEKLGIEIKQRIKREGIEVEQRFEKLHRKFKTEFETGTIERDGHTKEYKEVLNDLENVHDFIIAEQRRRKYEKAWNCLTERTYKNWND